MGYSVWIARLNTLALELLGRGLFTVLVNLIIRRRKPYNIRKLLPDEAKFIEMAVRAQKAASSFLMAAYPVALGAGLLAMLIDSYASAPMTGRPIATISRAILLT